MSEEDFILFLQVLARDGGRKLSTEQAKAMADTIKASDNSKR